MPEIVGSLVAIECERIEFVETENFTSVLAGVVNMAADESVQGEDGQDQYGQDRHDLLRILRQRLLPAWREGRKGLERGKGFHGINNSRLNGSGGSIYSKEQGYNMERLLLLDGENYTDDMPEIVRTAVRGIIFVDGKLLLIEDDKHEVKLPGGGQEDGETDIETLVREVREETGCAVITETVRPFGYIEEKRKGFHENRIWHQFSRLYFCDVTDERSDTEYSENEKKYGMRFKMYTLDEAIAKNRAMLNRIGALAWNQREYRTLLLIKAHMERGV